MSVLRVLGWTVLLGSRRRRTVIVGRRQGRYAAGVLAGNTCERAKNEKTF